MSVGIILHGVPDGHQVSKCDEQTSAFLSLFYNNSKGIQTSIKRRPNNDVVYTYAVYGEPGHPFTDYNGRIGSYFAISLIFHNQYASDSNKIFNLLQATYDQYVKNEIIQESDNGVRKWMYRTLDIPGDKITEYVVKCIDRLIKRRPEEFRIQTLPLPPMQQQDKHY